MKTIFLAIVVLVFLLVGAGVVLMYSGVYDVSASTPHSALSNWAMRTTMESSMQRRAKDIDVPDLSDPTLKLAGINDFEAMCVGCHGAPGKARGPVGQGINPPAPDLKQIARQRTAAELFWATRNGIKMTAMPAWSATHDDASLWPVVAFMTLLPDLDASGYASLLTQAAGQGHHRGDAGDHAHDDGSASRDDEEDAAVTSDESPEHDHSTHEH